MDQFIRRSAAIIFAIFVAFIYFGGFALWEARQPIGTLLYFVGIGLIPIAVDFWTSMNAKKIPPAVGPAGINGLPAPAK